MMDILPTPLREGLTLRQQAEEALRTAIATGRFLPGQRLTDRELTELLGVARSTVREAVRQLESEGLITTIPFRGPTVANLTTEEARDLYELRAILEGEAARLCAERGRPEHFAAILQALDAMRAAASDDALSGVMVSSADFYHAIFDGAGNAALKHSIVAIHNRLAIFRFSSTKYPGRIAQSLKSLTALAEAITGRDGDAARAAGIQHINGAAELALFLIGERAKGALAARRRRGGND